MFRKIHLSVTVALLFWGCKNIGGDYSALNEDGDRLSSPWAMVDLHLHEADDPEDEGEVNLHLSPHLTQDTRVNGVLLSFALQRGTLNFTAPDANNVATLAEEDLLISRVELNFVNRVDALVCPDNNIVAELDRKDEEDTIDLRDQGIIFSAMDLACSGNKLVKMNALADSIAVHAWDEDHAAVLEKVDEFYQEEKEKGERGALHKGKDQGINDHIDNFLIRRKMLKGYAAMHSELEKHNLAEIKTQAKDDSAKHIVIPTTLKSFLDVRVNNRVTSDDSMSGGENTDLLLLKEAIGNATAKFLQYDHLFQSDTNFASAETRSKFTALKGRLPPEVSAHVAAIEDQFNKLKTDEGTYSMASQVNDLLSRRLTCMDAFLTRHKESRVACESILEEFYQNLTSLSCGGEEVDDGDVFMLLTTRKIMKATNIYDPCDKYALNTGKYNEKNLELIRDSVADIKNTAIKAMEDILDSYPGQNFRAKVLQNYFYAAVPVVTRHPARAAELSSALAEAHEQVYAKRKSDEDWQGAYAFLGKVAAAAGIASVLFWVIPPAGAIVSGATSLLGALSVAGSGFVGAGYFTDWVWYERREYNALEKAIYAGGAGDVAGLADTMMEFREAKRNALWEMGFTVIGVGPARQLIKNPRALRTAYTRANLKNSWKGWRQARKTAGEAREAAKAWANSDEGIEAIQDARNSIRKAKVKLKETKVKLRQAEKNLKQNTDENAVEELQKKVNDLEKDKSKWLRLRSEYTDKLPKGRLKRATNWANENFGKARAWAHNKIRRTTNDGASGTTANADEVKGFFKSSIEKIKNARQSVYALNREARKSSERIKYMKGLASKNTKKGGKFYWKLNKDGSAFCKINDGVFKVMFNETGVDTMTLLKQKDFKLGKDGLWIAVLTADRVDKFFGDRGKRTIEGLPQLLGL